MMKFRAVVELVGTSADPYPGCVYAEERVTVNSESWASALSKIEEVIPSLDSWLGPFLTSAWRISQITMSEI